MKKFLKEHRLNILILLSLIVITYINSLNNVFLSDDIAEIRENPNIGNLWHAITSNPFSFIRLVFYSLAYHLGGLNPFGFRLINIFFHTGCVFLIYLILFSFYKSKKVAFFSAILFAVHPAISEAVVWISGGGYPQYSFFFLLSFFLYTQSENSRKMFALSVFSFFLSFMSHPVMPGGLFLIFLAYEFCFGNLRKNWVKVIPFVLILIVYVFINLGALPERETTLRSVHYQEAGIDNPVVLIPIAISSYLQLVIWPKDLTLYHSELAFGQIEFLARFVLTVIILITLFISFKKQKNIFFWTFFALVSLSPTLTPFRLNWIVAERYFYLPSLGVFTLLSLGLVRLLNFKKFKEVLIIIFIAVILMLAARTIIRNIDWKNEDNLWIATGKTSPSSPNTHNNLGDVYGRQGDKEAAAREFLAAIALKPNYADAYHNLANTYLEMGRVPEALENYQKAADLNPNLWQSYQNIAAVYFQAKEYDKALTALQKAIEINPKNLNLRNNLGVFYLGQGNKEKAKETFSLVLTLDPENQFAKQGLFEASK